MDHRRGHRLSFFGRIYHQQVYPSPQYESAALIGITRPLFQVDLEPSINNPSLLYDYREFIEVTKPLRELAEADNVRLSVCHQMGLICVFDDHDKPDLEASMIGTNQLKLTISCENPGCWGDFPNLWAEEVIYRWNKKILTWNRYRMMWQVPANGGLKPSKPWKHIYRRARSSS